jgi:predicted nucleotidyltransferase
MKGESPFACKQAGAGKKMYNFFMQVADYIHLLPEITRRIVSTSNPEKVILFGSYVRGDYHPR